MLAVVSCNLIIQFPQITVSTVNNDKTKIDTSNTDDAKTGN